MHVLIYALAEVFFCCMHLGLYNIFYMQGGKLGVGLSQGSIISRVAGSRIWCVLPERVYLNARTYLYGMVSLIIGQPLLVRLSIPLMDARFGIG